MIKKSSENKMQNFDVIVVGGGVAGLVASIEMAQAGLQIALIESREIQEPKLGQHLRVSALNVVSERILRQMDCWEKIPAQARSSFREIAVCDADGEGHVEFSYLDIGRSYLGHIVGNEALIKTLLERAELLPSFTLLCPAEPQALRIDSESLTLKTMDGAVLKAKLIVGADGANSWVRKALNIPFAETSYDHTAIVATIKSTHSHRHIARQRFLEKGPIAFLPLHDTHHCSIVWSTSPDHAAELMRSDLETLAKKMADSIDSELGEMTVVDKPVAFPLTMRHVSHYVHPRVALIGDAAHTIHPLAGQGMNLGILDAACLAEVVINNFQSQRDIGFVQNLRRYERWRRGDNQLMIEAMAFFKSGFATQQAFLKNLRDFTLAFTNRNRWLKKIFMHNAMGFRGELPLIGR